METSNYNKKDLAKEEKDYLKGESEVTNEPTLKIIIPYSRRTLLLLKRFRVRARMSRPLKFAHLKYIESDTFETSRNIGEISESTESPTEFDELYYKRIIDRLTSENLILTKTNNKLVSQIDNFQIQLQDLNSEIRELNKKIEELTEARTSRFRISKAWLDEDLEQLES